MRGDEAIQVNESAVFLPNKLKPSPKNTQNLKQDVKLSSSVQNDSINIDDKSTRNCFDSSSKKEPTGEKPINYQETRDRTSELSNVYLTMHAQNVQREREILETLGELNYSVRFNPSPCR